MSPKKRILLKLTGEIFVEPGTQHLTVRLLNHLVEQLKLLIATHQFGIVIGGGNFFRGSKDGVSLGMRLPAGHQVGMLATIMNGLILKDLFEQHALKTTLFCAIPTPGIGVSTSQQEIDNALEQDAVLIFTGGTGNPFFTTDTNAVLRGLQIDAQEIWKGTNVDGIYTADPRKDTSAELIPRIRYKEVLDKKLAIMDTTAFVLAEQHQQLIRIFNIFTENALIQAAQSRDFGSLIF